MTIGGGESEIVQNCMTSSMDDLFPLFQTSLFFHLKKWFCFSNLIKLLFLFQHQRHLDVLKEDSKEENGDEKLYIRIDHLTESLNGHPLPMVTITAPIDGSSSCSNNNQVRIQLLSKLGRKSTKLIKIKLLRFSVSVCCFLKTSRREFHILYVRFNNEAIIFMSRSWKFQA